MFRTIAILLVVLIFCTCSPQKSKVGSKIEVDTIQHLKTENGLKFKKGVTRGIGITDSYGSDYIIVHITNTITNDSTIPIHFQIDLQEEFSYPIPDDNHKFKIALWPGLTEPPNLYSDNTRSVSENFTINDLGSSNQFNKRLAPGEKYVVTIGTISPRQPNLCSVVAYSLVDYKERRNYTNCDGTIDEERSKDPQLALGIQVGFCTSGLNYEKCSLMTCGHISYIED